MTEKEFLNAVLDLAKLYGWRSAHFRPGLTQKGNWITAVAGDGKGFPDLVLARKKHEDDVDGRLIFAELKSEKGKLRPEQEIWLNLLATCGDGVETYVWRPSDMEEIKRELR